MKKTFFALLLIVLFLQSCSAVQFGNETENPSIADGSFKMMQYPQVDTQLFLQFQLIDDNTTPLENYHTELKIYDGRGVKVYPPLLFQNIINSQSNIAFSDSNGFVNYSIYLQPCNIFNNGENCFQLDQNYTTTITGKNIFREEAFVPKIKTLQTNWAGDFLRYSAINAQSFFIILLSIVASVTVIVLFYKGMKGK